MQQGVLAVHCFDRILKASTGKLIGQSFRRIANSVAAFQSAVFPQQSDVFSIVLQAVFDVASLPGVRDDLRALRSVNAFSLFRCAGDGLCGRISS